MTQSLVVKLTEVMKEVKYIQKRGKNKFHNYTYATEADVNDAVRDYLANRNVILMPSVKETHLRETKTKNGDTEYIARVDMDFTLIDGDSGEQLTLSMSGEGQDRGDKAIYKAISGTQKYALMKLFMIPTGDDPERDDTPAANSGQQQGQPQRNQQQPQGGGNTVASEGQVKAIYAKAKELAQLAGSNEKAIFETVAQNIGAFQSVETLDKQRASKVLDLLNGWIKARKGNA